MNEFDTLVSNVLNETAVDVIPALDGTREIYTISCNEWDVNVEREHPSSSIVVALDKHKMQKHLIELDDYIGTNFNEANNALTRLLKSNEDLVNIADEAIKTMSQFSKIPGTFWVEGSYSYGTRHLLFITVVIEVDVNVYSGAYNAIQDDINNF